MWAEVHPSRGYSGGESSLTFCSSGGRRLHPLAPVPSWNDSHLLLLHHICLLSPPSCPFHYPPGDLTQVISPPLTHHASNAFFPRDTGSGDQDMDIFWGEPQTQKPKPKEPTRKGSFPASPTSKKQLLTCSLSACSDVSWISGLGV